MNSKKYWWSNWEGDINANKLTKILLVIYLIVLVWILIFKLGVRFSYMGNRSVNLIPFSRSSASNGRIDLSEIILNVIVFMPLGIYAGALFRRWTWVNRVFFVFLISLLIEGLQYILRVGAFDITDIITNMSGGIIGLMMFGIIERLFNNKTRSQRFINIVAVMGTVLIISLLVLLKMNMLPIRYQ
jgi:glycopeptide antibiotics resistance protein